MSVQTACVRFEQTGAAQPVADKTMHAALQAVNSHEGQAGRPGRIPPTRRSALAATRREGVERCLPAATFAVDERLRPMSGTARPHLVRRLRILLIVVTAEFRAVGGNRGANDVAGNVD